MRELLRRYPRFFLWTALVGLALRLVFVFAAPQVTDDSRIYADIANNWVTHGIYGTTDSAQVVPTYIRLPGYPGFLVIIFALFGRNNFLAVMLIQVLVDLGTALLVADLARRTSVAETSEVKEPWKSDRAAKAAFLLAALCPFLANYSAAVLTETLEVFFTALALDLAVVGLTAPVTSHSRVVHSAWLAWSGCGLAIGAAILLRPDGGLLLVSIGLYLGVLFVKSIAGGVAYSDDIPPGTRSPKAEARRLVFAGVLVTICALAPLVPWTLRNLRTMHAFQPLAPRYANNPGDYVPIGFNRWVKTWIADYASTQEIYWQEPGGEIDATKLPSRAFDSPEQKQRTHAILSKYSQTETINPALDAQFGRLADERIHAAPLRYYVWLPLVRIVDMWVRPRTELTDADPRWWEFNDELKWSVLAVAFGVINVIYIVLAAVGLTHARTLRCLWLLLTFVILRSAFLSTLENPEPRYTLECYPVVIALAAAAVPRRLCNSPSGTYKNQ